MSPHHVGLMTSLILPATASAHEAAACADARRQALRLGLAAEEYRDRHGRFPKKLDDLVPDYISAVPVDPFDGKPMRMKRTDHGLIVYSIGPDMVDNGGAPVKFWGVTLGNADAEPDKALGEKWAAMASHGMPTV